MNSTQNCGYGYVSCSFDDPKRSHYFEDGEWNTPTCGTDCTTCKIRQHRKPVEIPEFIVIDGERVCGWELVPEGERVRSGDRWLYNASADSFEWLECGTSIGDFDYAVRGTWGPEEMAKEFVRAFIRRKPAVVKDGWLDAETVKPEPGQRVWFAHNRVGVCLCTSFAGSTRNWTHWKPAGDEVPKPPQSAKREPETKHGNFTIRNKHGEVVMAGIATMFEPKLRAWKLEEIPPGALFRRLGAVGWVTPVHVYDDGIVFVTRNTSEGEPELRLVSLEYVTLSMEHSTDGGKTWLPCGVME